MRRLVLATLVLAIGAVPAGPAAPAQKSARLTCKYGFKYVTKIVHGHKKRVKVCKTKPRPKPKADLVATLEPSLDAVTAGNRLVYVATFGNRGPAVATGVDVSVTFPAGSSSELVGVESFSDGVEAEVASSCEGFAQEGDAGFTWHCAISGMAPSVEGIEERPAIQLRFTAEPEDSGPFTVVAEARSSRQDAHPADNRLEKTIDVHPGPASADLSLEIHAGPGATTFPDDVILTVEVTNHGPTEATFVRVPMLLPLGASLLYVAPLNESPNCYGGSEPQSAIVCWDVIQPGDTVSRTVTLGMLAAAPPTLETNAVVSSYTTDPELGNNRASSSIPTLPFTPVVGVDLVTHIYPPIFYDEYAAVPFSIANRGTDNAHGGHIVVTSSGPLSQPSTGFFGTPQDPPAIAGCVPQDSSTVGCDILTFPGSQRVTGYFIGEVTQAGQATVSVNAVAPGADANPGDNSKSISFPVTPNPARR